MTQSNSPPIAPTVLLILSDNDRLHYTIEDNILYLMAGTSIKIGVPASGKLFKLLRELRVAVADSLVAGVVDTELEESELLLTLRKPPQIKASPCH